jgi:aspartyl/glutamyl-tRNA(Asn/Gln) amidotransferase B subunit
MSTEKYEAVIGLEVHAQMLTKSKAYSSDVNEYGAHPNTNVSVITLGHPGTLPRMNKKTIEYAIRLGLACGCEIAPNQYFARKNYFYPDLPKGYQITQDKTPICTGGSIHIKTDDSTEKEIGITRIHMEEDAGKSIHDVDLYDTLVDLNRAGVPLLEIVTEPDLRSSQEAYNYLTEVRKLVRYLDICDGNMEEGSMRCDANISVRLKGAKEFGTKVEVKNMNSIRNVQRAIEFEIARHIEAVENGVVNPLDAFASFNKLEKLFKEAKVKIDELARDEAEKYTAKTFTFGNVEFTRKDGAKKLNYSEDLLYSNLQTQLKAREELLKVAQKSTIYDDEGVEVPKVSISHNKDSLSVKFK